MPEVQLSVSLYVIISFAVIGVEDVFTIFASTETRLGEPSKVFVCMQFNQTFLSLFSRIFRCPHVSQFIRNWIFRCNWFWRGIYSLGMTTEPRLGESLTSAVQQKCKRCTTASLYTAAFILSQHHFSYIFAAHHGPSYFKIFPIDRRGNMHCTRCLILSPYLLQGSKNANDAPQLTCALLLIAPFVSQKCFLLHHAEQGEDDHWSMHSIPCLIFLHWMGYPTPLPIVRLVLICKATEICLKLRCLMSKIHCLANRNKPDNGQRHRVSQRVFMLLLFSIQPKCIFGQYRMQIAQWARQWAQRHHFLSVCLSLPLSMTRQKFLDNDSDLQNYYDNCKKFNM